MRISKYRLMAGFAAIAIPAVALADTTYIYNVGPNYVNMSGTSCRPSRSAYDSIGFAGGEVINKSASGTSAKRIYCPIDRRMTSNYTVNAAPGFSDRKIVMQSLTVFASRAGTSIDPSLSCWSFFEQNDGTVVQGAKRYLCSTPGGCTSPVTNYASGNTLNLPLPAVTLNESINFGYVCDLPGNWSYVAYAEAVVTPN